MTAPLVVLGALSVVGGFLNVPEWLAPVFPVVEHGNSLLVGISAAISVVGILIAYFIYVLRPSTADSIVSAAGPLYKLINRKYYVDEIYGALIVRPLEAFSRTVLWKGADVAALDGAVDGLGRRARGVGAIFRQMQSGSIRNYATWVMFGSLLILLVLGLSGGAR
jgi:NADH-quinone oxidoreductase subunit L